MNGVDRLFEMTSSPAIYRIRAGLIAHAITFTLLMFWSAVPNNVLSYFFAYRFLYPSLYLYGLWVVVSDTPGGRPEHQRASVWFTAMIVLCLLFDGFYLGYHMIYLTFSACAGQLGPLVCADAAARLRYVFTTIGVALLLLEEICLLVFVLLRNCYCCGSGKSTNIHGLPTKLGLKQ